MMSGKFTPASKPEIPVMRGGQDPVPDVAALGEVGDGPVKPHAASVPASNSADARRIHGFRVFTGGLLPSRSRALGLVSPTV